MTHPLAAEAEQALQGVTDLIEQANDVATDLSELPETTAWEKIRRTVMGIW